MDWKKKQIHVPMYKCINCCLKNCHFESLQENKH